MDNLAIAITINILVLLFYFFSPKNLQLLEIIYLWFVSTLLAQSISITLSLNLEVWKLSEKPEMFAILAANRFLLIPVLIIWFLDLMSSRVRLWARIALFAVLSFILTGVDYVTTVIKAMTYVNWNSAHTFAVYLALCAVCLLLLIFFQKKVLRRE